MVDNNLTLPAAASTWLPHSDRIVVKNEEKGATGGTPLSMISHSSSTISRLASIDLTQETLDEESREKLKVKCSD